MPRREDEDDEVDERPVRRRRDPDDNDDEDRDDDRRRTAKKKSGSGLMIGLGIAGALLLLVCCGGGGAAYYFIGGAVKEQKAAQNNLKQIGLGLHNYHDNAGQFTTPYMQSNNGQNPPADLSSRLSWRAAILPYIEQDNLFRVLASHEAWDSPTNRPVTQTIVKTFSDPRESPSNQTRYRVFIGGGAMFDADQKRGTRLADITDGTSNTIMVAESITTVPWGQFNEIPFDPKGTVPKLGKPGSGGATVLMADGSVRFLPDTTDPMTRKAMITRNGGEVVNLGQ